MALRDTLVQDSENWSTHFFGRALFGDVLVNFYFFIFFLTAIYSICVMISVHCVASNFRISLSYVLFTSRKISVTQS